MDGRLDKSTSIDIFTSVDARAVVMMKLLKKPARAMAAFCERCGCVCDAACRRAIQRERARIDGLLMGMRVV
jgi:hypothetical protein